MKKIFSVILCLTLLSALAGCSQANNQSENNSSDQSKPDSSQNSSQSSPSKPISQEQLIREAMLERSLVSVGNTHRVNKAISKAKSGERVTIAYIGGSITEGLNAGSAACFATAASRRFSLDYMSKTDGVDHINAGIGGTPSDVGLTRVENDVINKNPDIVFVEFAVNDPGSSLYASYYESLVRKLLESPSQPAVILLFTVSRDGSSRQAQQASIGRHYDLGMISVGDALTEEINAGRMSDEDYFSDGVHPNVAGHSYIATLIANYYKNAEQIECDNYTIPAQILNQNDFSGIKNIENGSSTLKNGGFSYGDLKCYTYEKAWKHTSSSEKDSLIFELECKSLFVTYKQESAADYGNADVYVDGIKVATLEGNYSAAWKNPKTALIFNNSDSKKHTVEIKMASGAENKRLDILNIAYCE